MVAVYCQVDGYGNDVTSPCDPLRQVCVAPVSTEHNKKVLCPECHGTRDPLVTRLPTVDVSKKAPFQVDGVLAHMEFHVHHSSHCELSAPFARW